MNSSSKAVASVCLLKKANGRRKPASLSCTSRLRRPFARKCLLREAYPDHLKARSELLPSGLLLDLDIAQVLHLARLENHVLEDDTGEHPFVGHEAHGVLQAGHQRVNAELAVFIRLEGTNPMVAAARIVYFFS